MSEVQVYVIPFEYTGFSRIKAASAAEAREMFNAMSDEDRLRDAHYWADDRTFTEAEYDEAIKETVEGPERAPAHPEGVEGGNAARV